MRKIAPVVLLVLLCACSRSEDKQAEEKQAEDKQAEEKQAEEKQPGAAAGTHVPPGAAGRLTCVEVVPPAMRDKHFAGHEVSEQGPLVQGLVTVACSFSPKGKAEVVTVTASCHADWSQSVWDATEAELRKQTKDAKDVAIGKGGFAGDFAGGPHLHALDDDTPCTIDVHGDADREAIARDALAALTPGALSP
jgi:hypothetical protein